MIYDTNLPTTGSGGVSLSLVTAGIDPNGAAGTFTGFSISSAGAVTALISAANGGSLTGGTSTTLPLGSQLVLSLLVNDTAATAPYLNGATAVTLPAFSADLYANSLAGGTFYIGRLTSFTGTNATTNLPQQLGFRTFSGNTFSARFNEWDVNTGLTIATVPEPSTYACLFVALGGLVVFAHSRRPRLAA